MALRIAVPGFFNLKFLMLAGGPIKQGLDLALPMRPKLGHHNAQHLGILVFSMLQCWLEGLTKVLKNASALAVSSQWCTPEMLTSQPFLLSMSISP